MALSKLALNLRRLRKERGLTTNQVADKCGIQPHAVRRWERAETKPTVDHIAVISRLYQCGADEILFGNSDDKHVVTVDVEPGQTVQIEVNAAELKGPKTQYRPPIKIQNDSKKRPPINGKPKRKRKKAM